MKNNPNKRLRLFDITRDGKGVSKKDSDLGTGLKRFFVTYKNHFNKILTVNIIMVLGNFPILFLVAALSGYTQKESFAPMQDLFQNLAGFFSTEAPSAHSMALYAITGLHAPTLVPSTLTYVFYGISALTLFTFGFVNVGTAYVLRNIAKGEPVFVWSDFWYAVKRNWKQALIMGIIDALINAILLGNIYLMIARGTLTYLESILLWSNVIIFIIYFFMRYYIYVQMVTFNLKIWKILKNSFIFALLGFKRNIVALLGIIICLVFEVAFVFAFRGILISFGVALPLLILFSTFAYMKVFAAYYKIKEVMIDPYNTDGDGDAEEVDEDDEPVMKDDVTEAQRLEDIKRRNGIID